MSKGARPVREPGSIGSSRIHEKGGCDDTDSILSVIALRYRNTGMTKRTPGVIVAIGAAISLGCEVWLAADAPLVCEVDVGGAALLALLAPPGAIMIGNGMLIGTPLPPRGRALNVTTMSSGAWLTGTIPCKVGLRPGPTRTKLIQSTRG